MISRGLLISVVLLGVLAGGVYWSNKAKTAEEAKPPKDAPPKLLAIPEDQIQKIQIQKKGAEPTVLERDKSRKWQIVAPKPLAADLQDAAAYLTTMTGLVWDRLIEDKASDLSAYGLASPSLEVTLTKKDGKTQKLLLGDDTPTGGDTFAKLDGDPRVFTISTSTKTSLDKTAKDLRDKRLLTFDPEKISRLELTAKGQTVELGRTGQNEWQILKPKPYRADGFQVEELVRKLKDAKMDPSVSDEDAKKFASAYANAQRAAILKVTDSSGTQQLEVHKVPSDKSYYVKSSVADGVYKVPTDVGEGFEKGLGDLRNRKLFDFGFNEPNKVELRDGDKTYSFQKSGEKWFSNGKQMDATSLQMLIDKLRDLTAIKFVDRALTAPIMEATVISNDGKRTEKVQISKVGDSYFAKRENEPTIYELDGKVVNEIQKAAADVKPPPPPSKPETKK